MAEGKKKFIEDAARVIDGRVAARSVFRSWRAVASETYRSDFLCRMRCEVRHAT